MKKRERGFVISWYYPPGNSSEGLVTFKLLGHSKYFYDVWTRANQWQNVWDRKSDERELVAKNVRTIENDCSSMEKWVKNGLEYFTQHRDEYDFIMSRSMPAESHELAIKIKERFPDIKWVASFGDPIVNTPYIDAITMNGENNPFRVREYLRREKLSIPRTAKLILSPVRNAKSYLWQRDKQVGEKEAKKLRTINNNVLQKADVLIYNNEYQYEHAFSDIKLKKYKNKGRILEHSFDADLYSIEQKLKNDKLTFIYVGHLDDTRNANSLFRAILHLKKKDADLDKKVSFDFYGHLSEKNKLYVLEHRLTDVIKIHEDVGYLESLKIIKSADWAILIDANFTGLVDDCIYLPAKLMDYIGARTKVFSISHVKGAGSDIIRDVGGGKVVTHNADDIYLYLSKIIYKGYSPVPYDEKKVQQYSAKEIAKKLDCIEDELMEN
ncbi:glycosyltransferase family 1 protein [Candidatus Saccharibacteria bacterium]|nr:glycosyltransferase family 1 protein [Candidatus Saccharibacteria bacterium]